MSSHVLNENAAGISRPQSLAVISGLVFFALLSGMLSIYLVGKMTHDVEPSSQWWVISLAFGFMVFSGYISGLCVKVFYAEVVFLWIVRGKKSTIFHSTFQDAHLFPMQMLFSATPILLLIVLALSPLPEALRQEDMTTYPWAAWGDFLMYAIGIWGVLIALMHSSVVEVAEKEENNN